MAFYSQIGQPGGMGGGLGGSPSASAFTSPGMDPMTLALLLRMQNSSAPGLGGPGAGGAPQFPSPLQGGGGAGPMLPGLGTGPGAGMPPGAAASPGAGTNPMGGLMQMLMSNPQMLQKLMASLGVPGGTPGSGPASGMPGSGTGGSY